MVDSTREKKVNLFQIAAAMVRGTYVCEKSHRNGEANPHIHFNDTYISIGRQLANLARIPDCQNEHHEGSGCSSDPETRYR